MPTAPAFPDDLRRLQTDLEAVLTERDALLAQLPHRPLPEPEPYTDPRGRQHPASPGWTDEDHVRVKAVRARQAELADAIATHPFWQTLDGPARVEARMALKHINDAGDREGAAA